MRLRIIVIPVVTLLFAASSALGATNGKLVSVTGKVFLTPPGKSEKAALAGIKLAAGTKIRTGDDGNAEVAFDDGSSLKVRPNSSLKLSGTKRQKKKKNSVLLTPKIEEDEGNPSLKRKRDDLQCADASKRPRRSEDEIDVIVIDDDSEEEE